MEQSGCWSSYLAEAKESNLLVFASTCLVKFLFGCLIKGIDSVPFSSGSLPHTGHSTMLALLATKHEWWNLCLQNDLNTQSSVAKTSLQISHDMSDWEMHPSPSKTVSAKRMRVVRELIISVAFLCIATFIIAAGEKERIILQ